jgi:(R,R)-butanediol dehydrogenase / meso-butanediol dehydrogenase / diacetyl reductase
LKIVDSMRAAVWQGPNTITVQARPMPAIPDGWALVRSQLTGLCGTDLSIMAGIHERATAPLVMGHEMLGVVEIAGHEGPRVGARVAVDPLVPCGGCWSCRHGLFHVCRNLQLFGIDLDGSLGQFIALPAAALIQVTTDVPATQAALTEPLAVAVHAVGRAQVALGSTVMLFGAGPIGILTGLLAQREGARRILISEPSLERQRVAETLGFEVLSAATSEVGAEVQELTGGVGADTVFDSAGHISVAAQLSAAARTRGTIVLEGLYKQPAPVDLHAVTFAEQSLVGVRVYTRRDLLNAAELIECDALGLDRLPVEVFPLDRVSDAFAKAQSGEVLKVFVAPA